MALPLPSYSEVTPLGAFMTSMQGANALKNNIYGTRIKQQEAKYAPYQAYGNAYLTNQQAQWLPYQYQMQALSNPLLWMQAQNNPDLQKQLAGMMKMNPMQAGGNMPNIPRPSSTSNGLLSMILSKVFGGGDDSSGSSNAVVQGAPMGNGAPQNAMIPMPDQQGGAPLNSSGPSPAGAGTPNPLVPATGGPTAAVTGKMTAPYNEQVAEPGKLYADPNHPGKVISVPTNEFVTNSQTALNAAKRVEPQLQRLSEAAGPFMSAAGQIGNQFQRGWNLLVPSHPGKLPTQYADFQSILKSSPEALVKAYGLNPTNETIERMQKVIEPYMGETQDQYKNRILNQLEDIRQEQVNVTSKQLSEGFPVDSEENKKSKKTVTTKSEEPTEEDINYTAKKYNMTPAQVRQYLGLK
jgi:hypothetical protein